MPVLWISPALNHSGSQHTVSPVRRWCPTGTPTMGVPIPRVCGHSPHACTVVAKEVARRLDVGGVPAAGDPPATA
jgi:hypothetical protein